MYTDIKYAACFCVYKGVILSCNFKLKSRKYTYNYFFYLKSRVRA